MVVDGHGLAAALELAPVDVLDLDVGALAQALGQDASEPSVLQIRVVDAAPPLPAARRRARPVTAYRGTIGPAAVHRRVQLLLRIDPLRAEDVVARHGGGITGAQSALIAALDRLAALLRAAQLPSRVLDAEALTRLLAEDDALPVREYLDASRPRPQEVMELVGAVTASGCDRSVTSIQLALRDRAARPEVTILLAATGGDVLAEIVPALLGRAGLTRTDPARAALAARRVAPLAAGGGTESTQILPLLTLAGG